MIAIYRGDTFIALFETFEEVAKFLGVKKKSAQFMSYPVHHKRNKQGICVYDYRIHDADFYEVQA